MTQSNAPLPMTSEVTITRIFNAPRDLVFRMWTDAAHLAQWWGPKGFTNPVCEIDARPGGEMRIHMRGPEGMIYPMTATFDELLAPERLVFRAVARDREGNPLLEALTTVSFVAQGGTTKLTVHARGVGIEPVAAQMLAGMEAGWTQSIERLEALVVRAARDRQPTASTP